MLYLAIQTFALLAATAGIFFAFGFFFHRLFLRAHVVVSDQPPADPPPHREDSEKVIRDLRSRLLEKERDLAQLLETVTPPGESHPEYEQALARVQELENDLGIAQRANSTLQDQLAERAKRIEQYQQELNFLNSEAIQREAELAEAKAAVLPPVNEGTSAAETEALKGEIQRLNQEATEYQDRIATLEVQIQSLEARIQEKDYLLEVASNTEKPSADLAKAADAIWAEDDRVILEDIEIGLPEEPEAPAEGMAFTDPISKVSDRFEELQARNESIEREFREKIRKLEATIDGLRDENERALSEFSRHEETYSGGPPPGWNPEPQATLWHSPAEMDPKDRDAMVEALWKAEKDAEKEKLRQSVEMLRQTLEQKEKSLEEMGQQLEKLLGKVDPKLQGPDNLELIKGIGPKIRKMLEKDFGIKSYVQVAKLTQEDIENISEQLYFKDKIQREDWVGQAISLHLQKYNEMIDVTDPPYPMKWVG